MSSVYATRCACWAIAVSISSSRVPERSPSRDSLWMSRSVAIVVRHDSELARRGLGDPFIGEVFSQEPTRQRVVQITRCRTRHYRLVKSDDPALAAFLEQARQNLRRHLALRAAEPAVVPAGALVYEEAARDLDANDRNDSTVRTFKLQLVDVGVQRRLDGVVADPANPSFDHVQLAERYAHHLPGLVVHSEDDGPPLVLAKAANSSANFLLLGSLTRRPATTPLLNSREESSPSRIRRTRAPASFTYANHPSMSSSG